jgi:hypothetical protein
MQRGIFPKEVLEEFKKFCEEHGWKEVKITDTHRALCMQRLGNETQIIVRGTRPEITYHTVSGIGAEFLEYFADQQYTEK